MKVVIDANVFFRAILSDGVDRKVLRLLTKRRQAEVLVSIPIADEIYIKLLEFAFDHGMATPDRIFKMTKHFTRTLVTATYAEVRYSYGLVKDDPEDNKYVDLALEAEADFLVTRDEAHILPLKGKLAKRDHTDIGVVTPYEMADVLEKKRARASS
ncbi:MAG: putative toxin-antitoxin system toxin component, PIN family [Bacillota bacterium]